MNFFKENDCSFATISVYVILDFKTCKVRDNTEFITLKYYNDMCVLC